MRDFILTGGYALLGLVIGATACGVIAALFWKAAGQDAPSNAGFEIIVSAAISIVFTASLGALVGGAAGGFFGVQQIEPEQPTTQVKKVKGAVLGLLIGLFIGIPAVAGVFLLLLRLYF